MGKPSRLAGKGAILAVAASLTLGVFTFSTMTAAPPAQAADTVVVQNDFESTLDPWVSRGAAQLAVTDSDAHGGSSSLAVTGRTDSWNGPSINESADNPVLTPGHTYTFSAWVKLTFDSQGPSNMKFTVQHNDTSDNSQPRYDSVPPNSNGVPVNTSDWVQIGDTYTYPADSSNFVIYIEASSVNGTNPSFLVDDVLITDQSAPAGTDIWNIDFNDGTTGEWTQDGGPTLTVMDSPFDSADGKILEVANRTNSWDGIQSPTNFLQPGTTYTFSMRARVAEGSDPLSMRFVILPSYHWVEGTDTVLTTTGWTTISGTYTIPADADPTQVAVYLGTGGDNPKTTNTYYVDDISISTPSSVATPDLNLEPIKDADINFPVGVAIAGAQTQSPQSDLLIHHYDQVTANNAMKPDGWYDADKNFRMSDETKAIMDFAEANGLRVYGHNLVWHSQVPSWFYYDENGKEIPATDANKAYLTQLLHDHIFNVAKALSDQYGLFGSVGNPLVAFDVVNEVVDDGQSDGLRHSPWYDIIGPNYIELAFQYADEAFNDMYADPSVTRPIALFINEFDTEDHPDKVTALHNLISRLLSEGIPVDGVGHQFHVTLGNAVETLGQALDAFTDLPIKQAVTEFDVALSTPDVPPTTNDLAREGYYYQDAFNIFRAFDKANPSKLFSVTLWGLADDKDAGDWLVGQAPLPFDSNLQAKSAYYGIINDTDDMAPVKESANVFRLDSESPVDSSSAEWPKLPLIPLDDQGSGFKAYWQPDYVDVYVNVVDSSITIDDAITFQIGDETYTRHPLAYAGETGDFGAANTATGYVLTARFPLDPPAKQGDELPFDVQVAGATAGSLEWNTGDALGTLKLFEPLSFVAIPETAAAPTIDGVGDDAQWADAVTISTDKADSRNTTDTGATAQVKLLWKGSTLYVLMDVADPILDSSSSNTYEQDSVEIYVDRGNAKAGSYRTGLDTQLRIGANGVTSFGSTGGDSLLDYGAVEHPGVGYTIEAAVDLGDFGGAGSYEGLDFQVNDGTAGVRTAIYNWADQTQQGFNSTYHWGVGLLLPLAQAPETPTPPSEEIKTGGTSVSTSAGAGVLLGTLFLAVGAGILARRFRMI